MDIGSGFTITTLYAALLGYALGSIPFGLILAKLTGKGDIRSIGSGNIGATNVLRTGSKGLAAATLLLDLAKGFVAVLLAWILFFHGPEPTVFGPVPAAALGAVLGHCFPIWLGFKGGKGVATNAGVCFGLGWIFGAAYAVAWIGVLALTRISSLAGMAAVVVVAVLSFVIGPVAFTPVLTAIALLVLFLHRANIGRLMRGEEPKVGSKG